MLLFFMVNIRAILKCCKIATPIYTVIKSQLFYIRRCPIV